MEFSHTKARNILLALSFATFLATYIDDNTVSAATVELDAINREKLEFETNKEIAETSESFEVIENVEVFEEIETHDKKENIEQVESTETTELEETREETTELEETIELEETREETTELEETTQDIVWKALAFNRLDSLVQGSGLPAHTLVLQDEQGVIISKAESDNEGLFTLDVPSKIAYQQLFIEIFNLDNVLIEKLEVTIHDEKSSELGNLELSQEVKNESTKVEIEDDTQEIEVDGELTTVEPANLIKKSRMLSVKSASLNGQTYYYIQSGDTLNSLAKHFGVTSLELQSWNNISNANNIYVNQLISVDGKNVYDEINKENKIFGSSAEFVKHLSSYASKVATEYGLYPSVMVAQSILESGYGQSGLSKVGNNLFGIKGTYKGNSIVMRTWEEVNNEVIWINAHFRLYPSFAESLVDNAELLRNGLDYAPDFYKGTWVENTKTYKDSTEWLTGRYATDSNYGTKLNNLIDSWDLTQHDPKPEETVIISTNIVRNDGSDREAVAVNVAKTYFSKSKKAIIVNRDKFSDAISATNISEGMYPVLYTTADRIDQATLDLLKSLPLEEIYVLGGTISVQGKVIDRLKKEIGVVVTRIDGKDRFEVNANAINLKYQSNKHVVIASGDIYTDALYGVSFANTIDSPVLLSKKNRLTATVVQLIKDLGVKKATLIGGIKTLDYGVEAQLLELGIVFDRIAGADRYSGSVAVAEASYGKPENIVIASGDVFSDALISAPLAQKLNAPILLVKKDRLEPEIVRYLKEKKMTLKNIYIQGGTRTISAANQVSIKEATNR